MWLSGVGSGGKNHSLMIGMAGAGYARSAYPHIAVWTAFSSIATARTTLRVDDGDVSHVLVHRWFGDGPSVDIHVANDYGESGYLKTTPAGDVVRSHPYEP